MNWFDSLFTKLTPFEERMTGKKHIKLKEEIVRRTFQRKDNNVREKSREPQSFSLRVCTKPLSSLRRTAVRELQVNIPVEDSYLLLRTLEAPLTCPPAPMSGQSVLTLAEDQEKELIICCLYGYVYSNFSASATELLPAHTVFVLKEPILKACSPQDFAVVVGSPSDFIIIGRSHVLYKELEGFGWRNRSEHEESKLSSKWKAIGNDLFQKGKYSAAADAYLFALQNEERDSNMTLTLHLNLSAAYLSSGYFEFTIKHTAKALEIQPQNEKALYRAGRAHYELKQFDDSKRCFEELLKANPLNKKASTEAERCNERLKEGKGQVDIYKLYRTRSDKPSLFIDHGDYVGPITFLSSPGRKRGVFATEDIEPGTLILAEKAFAVVLDPTFCIERISLYEKLVHTAIQAVLKNPNTLGKKVYSLPSGDNVADSDERLFCDPDAEVEPIVDFRRIYKILVRNLLNIDKYMVSFYPSMWQLFTSASRFSHSCVSNSTFEVYNDVIIIRTCSFVAKGEEINLCYTFNLDPFSVRFDVLKTYGFKCNCALCTLDRGESSRVHERRSKLKDTFMQNLMLRKTEASVSSIVKDLEESYRTRTSLRLHLFLIYCQMAKLVNRKADDWRSKLTTYVDKGLDCVGLSTEILLNAVDQVSSKLTGCALLPAEVIFDYSGLMAEMESASAHEDVVQKWVKVLIMLERIFTGGNTQMLKDRFRGMPKVIDLISQYAA